MFNVTVNGNKKMRHSGGKVYEYENYREADNMGQLCYGTQYDVCFTGTYETITGIRKGIGEIIKALNSGENVLAHDRLFVYNNKVYFNCDGDRMELGTLRQIKDNGYIFIF